MLNWGIERDTKTSRNSGFSRRCFCWRYIQPKFREFLLHVPAIAGLQTSSELESNWRYHGAFWEATACIECNHVDNYVFGTPVLRFTIPPLSWRAYHDFQRWLMLSGDGTFDSPVPDFRNWARWRLWNWPVDGKYPLGEIRDSKISSPQNVAARAALSDWVRKFLLETTASKLPAWAMTCCARHSVVG